MIQSRRIRSNPNPVTLAWSAALGATLLAAPVPAAMPERAPTGDAILLHDNGAFVTHPGAGPGGADMSRLQNSTLLMTIIGAGHSVSAGVRVADDFEVTAPSGWNIASVIFFAYQTGSTTTSTIDHVNFRIWDGPPEEPGSTVVFGDTATNRMSLTSWTNAYRATESAPNDVTRPIMQQTCFIDLHLDAGTYWIDWQSGGTLMSGPWAPPITILGQTTTGDALQQVPAAPFGPLLDAGSPQGLPFRIYGTTEDIFHDGFEDGNYDAWSHQEP